MKFLKFAVIALLLATVFFSSCKKDNNDNYTPPTPSAGIEGKWIGTYGFGNDVPAVYFAFDIKAGNVIDELNDAGVSKGGGTWTLSGSSFTAHYQWKAPLNTIYSVAATYNASTHKLSGTWGYGDNATNGGKWEQTKQ